MNMNCNICNTVLILNENFTEYIRKSRGYICKKCFNIKQRERYQRQKDIRRKYSKQYYLNNKENILSQNKKRWREKYITTTDDNGCAKLIITKKREHPENDCCELCNKSYKKLVYHHWDDSDPSKGLWLCGYCHLIAEKLDINIHDKYFNLKQTVEESKCQE